MRGDMSTKNNNLVLVVIKDKVSGLCTPPYCFANSAVSGRQYMDLIKPIENKNHYCLMVVGYYDNESGIINSCAPLVVIDGEKFIDERFNFKF